MTRQPVERNAARTPGGTQAAGIGTALLALLGLAGPAGAEDTIPGRQPSLDWLAGEYNNYEQVWQHGLDQATDAMVHVHIKVAQIALDGAAAYLLEAWQDDDRDRLVARQLYLPMADRPATVTRYELDLAPDAAGDGGRLPEPVIGSLAERPACVLQLTRRDDHIRAGPRQACPDTGLAPVLRESDGFELRADLLSLPLPGAERLLTARRVQYFAGWMGVKRSRRDPDAADDDWVFMKDFVLHNEGQIVRLVEKDGTATGFAIQLERLTYQNTRTAVLKLGLIDEAVGKTITYTWTSPGAGRIGMNLRWFQAGLTRYTDKTKAE